MRVSPLNNYQTNNKKNVNFGAEPIPKTFEGLMKKGFTAIQAAQQLRRKSIKMEPAVSRYSSQIPHLGPFDPPPSAQELINRGAPPLLALQLARGHQ